MLRYLFIFLALCIFSFHSNDVAAWGWGNNYYLVVPQQPRWGPQPQIHYPAYDPVREQNMLMQNHLMMQQGMALQSQQQMYQQQAQLRQQMAYLQRLLTKVGYNTKLQSDGF